MKNFRKIIAFISAVSVTAGLTACAGSSNGTASETTAETTTALTVAVNTETLAPEQQEQVADIADSLTGELENKTVKWLSFYDPWHPTGAGNTKPVSVELFEKKYGGEIEYYASSWSTIYTDLSTYVLSGEGIDFFPASEAVPKCVMNNMTQSFDSYIDWTDPLWEGVKSYNDSFAINGSHYLIVCQPVEGYVVYYNRKTIEENGLEDPAELYENGEWTMSKFKDMLSDYVDNDNGKYGLDGWFNAAPIYLAGGVPTISMKDGKVTCNLTDPNLERMMAFEYDLSKNGLILDKSLFGWQPQIQYMGEGKELFYISGLYEIESSPDIWTKTFGDQSDVFFVPVPRDEDADKYYYNAEFDCYNLCSGAQNPEGVARLMECVIASYNDENAQAISDKKHIDDYGWSQDMIDMRNEVRRLTRENPVRDLYGGLPDDISSMISNAISEPLNGNEWYSVRESIADAVQKGVDSANSQLS